GGGRRAGGIDLRAGGADGGGGGERRAGRRAPRLPGAPRRSRDPGGDAGQRSGGVDGVAAGRSAGGTPPPARPLRAGRGPVSDGAPLPRRSPAARPSSTRSAARGHPAERGAGAAGSASATPAGLTAAGPLQTKAPRGSAPRGAFAGNLELRQTLTTASGAAARKRCTSAATLRGDTGLVR